MFYGEGRKNVHVNVLKIINSSITYSKLQFRGNSFPPLGIALFALRKVQSFCNITNLLP
jgi:hypothetical protein